jgi:hypothetical protein
VLKYLSLFSKKNELNSDKCLGNGGSTISALHDLKNPEMMWYIVDREVETVGCSLKDGWMCVYGPVMLARPVSRPFVLPNLGQSYWVRRLSPQNPPGSALMGWLCKRTHGGTVCGP